jgi:hypothetical protein
VDRATRRAKSVSAAIRASRPSAPTWGDVDPQLVIVSGEAIRFGRHLTDAIRQGFERQYPLSKPNLVVDWISDYWARGAAALAVQSFF